MLQGSRLYGSIDQLVKVVVEQHRSRRSVILFGHWMAEHLTKRELVQVHWPDDSDNPLLKVRDTFED